MGFRLRDMAGLVVGFALAAMLTRSFARSEATAGLNAMESLAFVGVFSWLGLAMSGPLLVRPAGRRTRAETAWLVIGLYWIGLTAFVVPSRSPGPEWFGFVPLALLLVWVRTRPKPGPAVASWTHRAALGVLLGWPPAWAALVYLAG